MSTQSAPEPQSPAHEERVIMMRLDDILIVPERRDWMPRPTDEEHAVLVREIMEYGIKVPLILDKKDNSLVDGFSRYRAADDAQLEYVPVVMREFKNQDEMLALVLTTDAGRRRLDSLQRFLVYVRHRDFYQRRVAADRAAGNVSRVRDRLAELLGIGTGRTFDTYMRLFEKAPDLMEKLTAGEIGVREAERQIREREQKPPKAPAPPAQPQPKATSQVPAPTYQAHQPQEQMSPQEDYQQMSDEIDRAFSPEEDPTKENEPAGQPDRPEAEKNGEELLIGLKDRITDVISYIEGNSLSTRANSEKASYVELLERIHKTKDDLEELVKEIDFEILSVMEL